MEESSPLIKHKINECCRKGGNRKKMNSYFNTKNTRSNRNRQIDQRKDGENKTKMSGEILGSKNEFCRKKCISYYNFGNLSDTVELDDMIHR